MNTFKYVERDVGFLSYYSQESEKKLYVIHNSGLFTMNANASQKDMMEEPQISNLYPSLR
jgi:hypothetical protein